MNWILLAQIINLIILMVSLYFLMKRRIDLLFVTLLVAITLHGFNFLFATLWYPFKVVNIIIFLFVIVKLLPLNIDKRTYGSFAVIFFIAFINALFNLPVLGFNTGMLQSPLIRPLIQLYTYFSTFSLIIFMPYIIKTKFSLYKIDKYYMRISELIVLGAVIHFVFLKLGLEFMPILRFSGEHSEVANFASKGIVMERIYGFSGEPKNLGTILLPYFFISFYKFLSGIKNRSRNYHIFTLVVTLFVIIQTYSSAVLIGLFLAFVLGFALKFFSLNNPKIIRAIFVLSLLFLLGNNLIDRGDRFYKVSYFDFLKERTIGRVENEIDERFEILVLDQILRKSTFPIMGFGPGMYVFAIEGLVFSKGIEKIDSGWVTVFSDLGILGVLLYLLTIILAVTNRSKINPMYKNIYNAYLLGLISVATGMLGNNEPILFPMFIGFTISIYILGTKNSSHKNKTLNS